jgi:hypothetical protein
MSAAAPARAGMTWLLSLGKKRKTSIPLRVDGKVVILQCRFAIQRRQCKTVNVDAFDSDDKT